MGNSPNFLNGLYGGYIGGIIGFIQGDTRSLDYRSCAADLHHQPRNLQSVVAS